MPVVEVLPKEPMSTSDPSAYLFPHARTVIEKGAYHYRNQCTYRYRKDVPLSKKGRTVIEKGFL